MSKPGDLSAGCYVATSTVDSARRNLFYMAPGKERHIGTLVGGSRTRIAQFDVDCERIVLALTRRPSRLSRESVKMAMGRKSRETRGTTRPSSSACRTLG